MERCFILSGGIKNTLNFYNLYIARKIYDPLLLSSSFKAYRGFYLRELPSS